MAALSTLDEWSIQHIRDVFEAPTDSLSLRAIADTFSTTRLQGSANGASIDYTALTRMVHALRQQAPRGLSVEWTSATAFPDDSSNRAGYLVGEYVIGGIWRRDASSDAFRMFERRKKVRARIESQSSDTSVDSRRIVKLDFVGVDVPIS